MADQSLAELMSQAARDLQNEDDPGATMQVAVDLAVEGVPGADAATLTIARSEPAVEVGAASDPAARYGELLQHELGEGPCIDAVWEDEVVEVVDFSKEQRWPQWTARIAEETPFRSLLAVRAFLTSDRVGALNMYSREPNGFGPEAREYSLALASHVAIAVRDAQQLDQMSHALDTRTVIGQATGILMERADLDPPQAFAVLARVASTTERKVRDIAEEFVVTRTLPGTPPGVGKPARALWPQETEPEG